LIPDQPAWYAWSGDTLLLELRVQPRAGQDAFVEPLGDCYKVRIKAPPVEGKANLHLRRWLAKMFGVSQDRVDIVRGANSRNKRVSIRTPSRFPIEIGKPT
jgi:uncharacterized protein (TIGR00251 family)